MARVISTVTQSRYVSSRVVNVIGFPIASGQPNRGTELAPQAIRKSGLREKLLSKGWTDVHDSGDLPIDSPNVTRVTQSMGKNSPHVSAACHMLSQAICDSVPKYDKTVVLGGDHSQGIGSIHGHWRSVTSGSSRSSNELAVLWIDAHADIHTEETSKSRNLHGMPVGFLIKELNALQSFDWMTACVSAKHFAFIGLRDVEDAEQELLKRLRPDITVFTSADVKRLGAKEVILKSLESINPNNELPIHVSFDIDVLDPRIAASTGTPCPNGLVPDDVYVFGEHVCKTAKLQVLDMVEVNPLIGSEKQVTRTAFIASEIVAAFIGQPTDS